MKLTWRTEWLHWVLLLVMFALAAASWDSAPDRIPVHWGIDGRVDRYGGRFEGLLAMPMVALGLYLAMRFLPRIDPGRANYEGFAGAYATIRLAVLALMAGIYGVVHLWIRDRQVRMETVVPLLLGALFVVLGNALGKLRPNWFFGIRTPWTLSSKLAWTRTHRAGGWIFIAIGVLTMGMAVAHAGWVVWFAIAAVAVGVLGLVVYSYLLWRSDPDKVPPAGTLPA